MNEHKLRELSRRANRAHEIEQILIKIGRLDLNMLRLYYINATNTELHDRPQVMRQIAAAGVAAVTKQFEEELADILSVIPGAAAEPLPVAADPLVPGPPDDEEDEIEPPAIPACQFPNCLCPPNECRA